MATSIIRLKRSPVWYKALPFLLIGLIGNLLWTLRYVQASPLPMPAVTGPLTSLAPFRFRAGPLGQLDITGLMSGFGAWQDHPVPGDRSFRSNISNAQVFIQKTHGWIQFFLQAGAYNLPALGTPFISTGKTVSEYYGALPQAFLKIIPSRNFSIQAGKLPTLIGAEYTFTFENMNIERGLLWNQENAIERGVQFNYSVGPLAASLQWGDGFYSNRYNWVSGELSYTINPVSSLSFVAMGHVGQTDYSGPATPLDQNNSDLYSVVYTYSSRSWIIQPYFQYTSVSRDLSIGVSRGTSTRGVALLASNRIAPGFFLAARVEYITSTGNVRNGAADLLYGPGSRAWSMTLTPTWQNGAFFARAEFSFVRVLDGVPGDIFGPHGDSANQARILFETGFMF
jgi:hypothetical protein